MKCHGCGHEFSNASTRCPRCHRAASRRGKTSTESRLLEFPRRARVSAPAETTAAPLPAWRLELNEKVRAIKAKRDADSQPHPRVEEATQLSRAGIPASAANVSAQETRIAHTGNSVSHLVATRLGSNQQPASHAAAMKRSTNNIVEAALIRVKRASENASRAALPKIEPARSIQGGLLAVDREATARALEPAIEVEPRDDFRAIPMPEVIQPPIPPAQPSLAVRRRIEPIVPAEPVFQTSNVDDEIKTPVMSVIDEIEPLDYLDAEVRKVGKALGAEFLKNESPSIFTHAVIGIVDLFALALSCAPFFAIVSIADGSFSNTHTRLASGGILFLVSFFYLALTHCLCGRTFGMMLTNTRVVDARTFEAPSSLQALLRAAAYFPAGAPALLGIIWAVFDRKHRGWHDILSGTLVVRDF